MDYFLRGSAVGDRIPDEFILAKSSFYIPNGVHQWVSSRFSIHPGQEHLFVLGTECGEILLCDASASLKRGDRFVKKELESAKNAVFDFCFLPGQENLLVSLSGHSLLSLWDLETGVAISLIGHSESVRCASVWPENPFCLVTGSHDGSILFWDLRQQPILRNVRRAATLYMPSLVSTGQYATAHEKGSPRYLSPTTSGSIKRGASSITGLLHLGETYIISSSASASSGIRIWDLRYRVTTAPIRTLCVPQRTRKEAGITSLCWDRFRSSFFAACTDNHIYEYVPSVNTQEPIRSLTANNIDKFSVQCCASPVSDHLLCGSSHNRAYIWDLQEPRKYPHHFLKRTQKSPKHMPFPKFSLGGHSDEVDSVQWSSRGEYMLSLDGECLRVWANWVAKDQHGYPQELVLEPDGRNNRVDSEYLPHLFNQNVKLAYPNVLPIPEVVQDKPQRESENDEVVLVPTKWSSSPAHQSPLVALSNLPSTCAGNFASCHSSRGNRWSTKTKTVIKSSHAASPALKITTASPNIKTTPQHGHSTPRMRGRNLMSEFANVSSGGKKRPRSRESTGGASGSQKRKRGGANGAKTCPSQSPNILSYFSPSSAQH